MVAEQRAEPDGDVAAGAEVDAALADSRHNRPVPSTEQGSRQARRVQTLGGRPFQLLPGCSTRGGHGLHAGDAIGAEDRDGLRRMEGSTARPPRAKERLEVLPGDWARIGLSRPRTADVDVVPALLARDHLGQAGQLETGAGERRTQAVGRPLPHSENNHHAGMLCSSSYSTVNAFFLPSRHLRRTRPRSPSA